MREGAQAWPPALLCVAASGLAVGVWLWLIGLPTARVLFPNGDVGYLRGPSSLSLPVALALGLGGLGLAWFLLGLLRSRLRRGGLGDSLKRLTPAYLPLVLLLVDAARLLLPLGGLTNPVVILTYEGRWVLAGAVALTAMILHVRLFVPALPKFRIGPRGLAVGTFLGVLTAYLVFLPRAVLVGPTGDEPDYLLLAHSLVVDRDFAVQNNLEARDYLRFVPRLQPHLRPSPGGELYSAHRLGLPLLIAPAYTLGLLAGWPVRISVVVFLCLAGALLAARTATFARALTGHPQSALLAGLAMAFSAPGFFYAYAIYPELPVALIVLELLRRLALAERPNAWVVGLLVASLPWFHEKFVLLALVLTGCALLVLERRARVLLALLLSLGVSGLLQAAYYWLLYGRPVPFGVHAGFGPLASSPAGLIGLWLDRDHGLLPLAPIYLLALAGMPRLLREQPRLAVMGLGIFLSLYGVVGSYREWWGGFAPAPRYLVPLVPLLAIALAFGIRETLAAGRVVRTLLLAGVSGLVATYAVIYPALQYRHAHPLRDLFAGIDWTRYLPSWVFPDDRTWPLAGLAVIVAGLWVVGGLGRPVSAWPGLRLTAVGALSLLGVIGVVLAGDLLSRAHAPYLPQEEANRELRAFLLRWESGPPARGEFSLRARAPLPPEPLRLVYEAERLPGQGHRRVEDPLAENGVARTGGQAGAYLVFGPYDVLPRGAYRASFRLRAEAESAPGWVARLEVSAEKGEVLLGSRQVRLEDLSMDDYREVGVDFALPARMDDLEWRVWLERPGALRIDRISVIPLGLSRAVVARNY